MRINLEKLPIGLRIEISENVLRKPYTEKDLGKIQKRLKEELARHTEQGKRTDLLGTSSKNLEEVDHGVLGVIGGIFGESHETARKRLKIWEAYEANPGKYGNLMENLSYGRNSLNYAYTYVMRRQKPKSKPLPEGVFDVIYVDPPWDYEFSMGGAPLMHYPTMETKEIAKIKIPAAKDSVLFLWATSPKLKDALFVMESWGFEYKTNAVWVKDKFGTGYYFREKHELLLVGKKGKMPVPNEENRPVSVIEAPRKEHSVKPDKVYEIIQKMYPGCKYLELFARKKREGWASWGDEVG